MQVLQKSPIKIKPFPWLNFNSLPDSKGYKFELYLTQKEVTTQDLVDTFYKLFEPFIKKIEIGTSCPPADKWGDFCIDTWNIQTDTYDYSPIGKSSGTALYLRMLEVSKVEPSYQGLCTCQDWDHFLPIVVECIITGIAIYSLRFYCHLYQFMFYFHHTGSLGVYYKKFNDATMHILKQAKAAQLELWNWNDEESLARLRGDFTYMGKS